MNFRSWLKIIPTPFKLVERCQITPEFLASTFRSKVESSEPQNIVLNTMRQHEGEVFDQHHIDEIIPLVPADVSLVGAYTFPYDKYCNRVELIVSRGVHWERLCSPRSMTICRYKERMINSERIISYNPYLFLLPEARNKRLLEIASWADLLEDFAEALVKQEDAPFVLSKIVSHTDITGHMAPYELYEHG